MRPLLLLDVDGVLLPTGVTFPADYEAAKAGPFQVRLSPALKAAMPALLDAFDVHWVTSWNHDANKDIAPLFGLPELPVVEIAAHRMKLVTVQGFAAPDRAFAWAEDRLEPEAHAWAATRTARTLLLAPDPKLGLTPDDVDRLLAFAAADGDGDGD